MIAVPNIDPAVFCASLDGTLGGRWQVFSLQIIHRVALMPEDPLSYLNDHPQGIDLYAPTRAVIAALKDSYNWMHPWNKQEDEPRKILTRFSRDPSSLMVCIRVTFVRSSYPAYS